MHLSASCLSDYTYFFCKESRRTVLATVSFNTPKCQELRQHPLNTLMSVIPILAPSLTTNKAAASCLPLDHDLNMPTAKPLSNSDSAAETPTHVLALTRPGFILSSTEHTKGFPVKYSHRTVSSAW